MPALLWGLFRKLWTKEGLELLILAAMAVIAGFQVSFMAEQNDISERLVALEKARDVAVVELQALKLSPDGTQFELYAVNKGLRPTQLGTIRLSLSATAAPSCIGEDWRAEGTAIVLDVNAYREKYSPTYPLLEPGEAGIPLVGVEPCRAEDLSVEGLRLRVTAHPTMGEVVSAEFTGPWDRSEPDDSTRAANHPGGARLGSS